MGIWYNDYPIPVIGGCGEYKSGKSLFGMTLAAKWTDEGEPILPLEPNAIRIYDLELSCKGYARVFGVTDDYIDVSEKVPSGFSNIQMFDWWLEDIRKIDKRYTVIMVDPVTDLESGLVAKIRNDPARYGYTANQFSKSNALLMSAVKEEWKRILLDLPKQCEVFYFTSHMRYQWKGNAPSTHREPKGKDTLPELASLYLHFDRSRDAQGRVPRIPSATKLKDRIVVYANGMMQEALPPRIPIATPWHINQYIQHPYNVIKPKKSELLQDEKPMTEDERKVLEAQEAADRREAAALELEREQLRQRAAEQQARARAEQRKQAASQQPPSDNGGKMEPRATAEQVADLRAAREVLQIPEHLWSQALARHNAKTEAEMSQSAAAEAFQKLKHQIDTRDLEAEFQKLAKNASTGGA